MSGSVKLSVVLATLNEEQNIAECLKSVQGIADEIIIVDGESSDRTVEIAKSFGAKVTIFPNPPIFHINKQKAIDRASGEWILQLDADERVSGELAAEIKRVTGMTEGEIDKYQQGLKQRKLFFRHQQLIAEREGRLGWEEGEYAAFFVPRLNFFLGRYLKFGGVYPDGVIRLIKKGKAYLPCQSVHELMTVEGKVGWLENDLLHLADPTFARYIERNNRYIDLLAAELRASQVKKDLFNFVDYFLIKPLNWFFMTQIRHKGILDGIPGIIFSFFSSLRFPRAYLRYLLNK